LQHKSSKEESPSGLGVFAKDHHCDYDQHSYNRGYYETEPE